jgi:hypothetical protein
MAYSYIWPSALPQKPQTNFSETGGVNVLRTPQDKGPAKQRRVSKRIDEMQLSFHMSNAQCQILKDFVENTIQGTARFGYAHPITGQIQEVRIVPQEAGLMYTKSYVMLNVWSVSMTFEVLP